MKQLLIASALVAALAAAAGAQQDSRVHIRGKIVTLTGNVLTVGAPIGDITTKVTLAPKYTVQYVVKASLNDIKAGSFVGTAAVPQVDGSLRALEVHIFPPGVTPGQGSRPYDLTPTSTMTNGTVDTIAATKVDNVKGGKITVSYEGGSKDVTVSPATPVVTYAPATSEALMPGARVNILATKNPDGSLTATGVSVGKDGLIPPM
jgi:Domain of unknown function (DUF5666)